MFGNPAQKRIDLELFWRHGKKVVYNMQPSRPTTLQLLNTNQRNQTILYDNKEWRAVSKHSKS